jgi:antitoxin component of MazEF toxin-antitoxin module
MKGAMNKPTDIQAARALRVVAIDGAQGVILPADVLAQLGAGSGGTIDLLVKNGEVLLRAHDSGFAMAMAAAEEIMAEDREILAVLAK